MHNFSASNERNQRPGARMRRRPGRADQLARLLEQAQQALVEALGQRRLDPAALADTLIGALQGPALLGVRLELRPPYPASRVCAADQLLAAALQQLKLPHKRQLINSASPDWPACLPRQGQLLVLPLRSSSTAAGLLYLWSRQRRRLSCGRLYGAETRLASLLLAGAEQGRLQEQLEPLQAMQQALLEVGGTLDQLELQRAALRAARRVFACDQSWLVADPGQADVKRTPAASWPPPPEALALVEASRTAEQACALALAERDVAFACSAVVVGTQPLGALLLQRQAPFTPHELRLLEDLARGVGQGLRNARIYEDAQATYGELRDTLDQLIQAERLNALGEIARGMAHDFNNLLTIISSHTQFLLEQASAEQRPELEAIVQAVHEGSETLAQLREFSRASNQEPQRLVSVNALASQAVELIAPLLQRAELQRQAAILIELELQPVEELRGSPGELRQMLMRLLHNSLDALPSGGSIQLRTWQEGNFACLQIRDNGVGMAEEVRRRVFDPFFSTRALRGSGLGLSMVYGVVRRHGGSIEVESAPGAGTTMNIRLPCTRGTLLAEKLSS